MADSIDSKRYRTFCGQTHVERAAFLIASASITVCAVPLAIALAQQNLARVIAYALTIITTVSIIVAQWRNQPLLYLPYLVVAAVGVAFLLISALACIFLAIFALDEWAKSFEWKSENSYFKEARWAALATSAWMLAWAAFFAWLVYVVYLAYEYAKMTRLTRANVSDKP